ncbi:hypothetical protein GGR56DRAFT_463360 [Xylariaceae sp. FL0804]|nr:hypothetical protein GGR56DRAFT_463360 [Xylariaceae sp. FL0804]
MEDGWVLAQCLRRFANDPVPALELFDRIRLPYYSRMYAYLGGQGEKRLARLREIERAVEEGELGDEEAYDARVRSKIITDDGGDMGWIYENHIGDVFKQAMVKLGNSNGALQC